MKTDMSIAFGEALSTLIKNAGKTKKAFGEEIGASQNMVSRWTSGSVIPGGAFYVKICDALHVTWWDFGCEMMKKDLDDTFDIGLKEGARRAKEAFTRMLEHEMKELEEDDDD